MTFPTMQEVEDASHAQLALWYRFLPREKMTPDQEKIVARLKARFLLLGGMTPEMSRKIGWNKP
jgi:hypothetical protein